MSRFIALGAFAFGGVVVSAVPGVAHAESGYRVTAISVPKPIDAGHTYGSVTPTAINSAGVVVGTQVAGANTSGGSLMGFVLNGTTSISTLGDRWSTINDQNMCGGTAYPQGMNFSQSDAVAVLIDCVASGTSRLTVITNSPLAATITRVPGTAAGVIPAVFVVNATGQSGGQQPVSIPGPKPIKCDRAFAVTTANVITDLGALPNGCNSAVTAMNASGNVAGWSDVDVTPGRHHAVRWQGSAITDLGTLGGSASEASAMTDSGQTVGFAETAQATRHAAVWAAGSTQARDLGTLGGAESRAFGVSKNRVVGTSQTVTGAWHAFVYDLDTSKMTDINDWLPANSGWVLNEARAMNAGGSVVGVGMQNNVTAGFFLSPFNAATLNTPAAPRAPVAAPGATSPSLH